MKKLMALLLAAVMVLSLAACSSDTEDTDTTAAETTEATEAASGIAAGTSWNAIDNFNYDGSEDSVWQYYFYDASDSSYNAMGSYEERSDGSLCEWYPWESSWVGVGFNSDVEGFLELNADGESMMAVLAFVAPATGSYVITSAVYNPWDQSTDLFTVEKSDGTVVLAEDISGLTATYGYISPTDVELNEGDILYIYCGSTSGWVSAYANVTIYYEPTDDSVYEVPEVEIPVTYTFVPSATADYSATAEFNASDVWVYASTSDGVTFTEASYYDEPDWYGTGEASAAQWYSENGTGIGYNYGSGMEYLEANVSESYDNGGEAMALGFVAPADGTYVIAGYTLNMYGQDAEGIAICYNGEILTMVDLVSDPTEFSVTVDMAAGDVVYIYGVSNSGWVSAYIDVYAGASVELTGEWIADDTGDTDAEAAYTPVADAAYSAVDDFSSESADGVWVYASTTDGIAYTLASYYDEPDWYGTGEASAAQWYSENGTGIGFNYDSGMEWLEANVSESYDNGGEAMALGFKAPADGTYTLTIFTLNMYGQDGGDVTVTLDGSQVGTVGFTDTVTEGSVTVTLEEGQIVYISGTSNSGWVSAYISVYVTEG